MQGQVLQITSEAAGWTRRKKRFPEVGRSVSGAASPHPGTARPSPSYRMGEVDQMRFESLDSRSGSWEMQLAHGNGSVCSEAPGGT